MRAEQGRSNGGRVPFAFVKDSTTHILSPDPEQLALINQLFQIYVESRSDFVVRDWLQAHQVKAPNGDAVWKPSTIRDLLSNRRYIGEIEFNKKNKGIADLIEFNKKNKGIADLNESDSYRAIPAPHEPLVPKDLFDLAQVIRAEKALESPNRGGRPRNFSQNQCGRIYLLNNILVCGICGSSMSAHYTKHKAGTDGRINPSYVHYYECARQIKGVQAAGHRNRVLARISETWILNSIDRLLDEPEVIIQAMSFAQESCAADLRPQQESLCEVKRAIQKNQDQIDKLLDNATKGNTDGALASVQ